MSFRTAYSGDILKDMPWVWTFGVTLRTPARSNERDTIGKQDLSYREYAVGKPADTSGMIDAPLSVNPAKRYDTDNSEYILDCGILL